MLVTGPTPLACWPFAWLPYASLREQLREQRFASLAGMLRSPAGPALRSGSHGSLRLRAILRSPADPALGCPTLGYPTLRSGSSFGSILGRRHLRCCPALLTYASRAGPALGYPTLRFGSSFGSRLRFGSIFGSSSGSKLRFGSISASSFGSLASHRLLSLR